MKKFSVKTIVAIGIGAALFFVLGRFVAIPSPVPNTSISVQYGLLAFLAVVYGPVAGALVGLIGHTLMCHLICWLAVAPVLDVYMMGEPWDKLIAQGLMAAVSNAVTTAIVGSLLCIAYAATKTKAGSLTKE